MPTPKVTKFGPGTLTLDVVAPIDISCQLITAQIEWSKDKDDDETVLCGDVVAGATTYTAQLTGEMFQDVADAAGILHYSWAHKGEIVPFTFTPNTAAGTEASGDVVLDPLTFGSDEPKANMRSRFHVGHCWRTHPRRRWRDGRRGRHRGRHRGRVSSGVTVRGAAELERTARAAARELENLAAVNSRVAAGILTAADPPVLTGRLAASLTSSSSSNEATVSSSVRYAGIVERRTGFLARALTTRTTATLELYGAHVNAAVGKVRGV